MKIAYYYNFFPTKEEEEEKQEREGKVIDQRRRFTLVEQVVTSEPPKTLALFPWEIRKVLASHEVRGYMVGLELSAEQAYNHVFRYWDSKAVMRVDGGGAVAIVLHDWDTDTKHDLLIKKMNGGDSYRIVDDWKKDFVERRGLEEGMSIGLYWHARSNCLWVTVIH